MDINDIYELRKFYRQKGRSTILVNFLYPAEWDQFFEIGLVNEMDEVEQIYRGSFKELPWAVVVNFGWYKVADYETYHHQDGEKILDIMRITLLKPMEVILSDEGGDDGE